MIWHARSERVNTRAATWRGKSKNASTQDLNLWIALRRSQQPD
jgi:hypothetical protein